MDIKPIKTDADYEATLAEIESLMDSEPDTPEGDRLDVLVTLVEAYEAARFPIDAPDPVEAVKFRMEQMGLTRRDLEPMIGPRGRVSEILAGKRPLSLAMIRRLHAKLRIPAEVLIREAGGARRRRRRPASSPARARPVTGGRANAARRCRAGESQAKKGGSPPRLPPSSGRIARA